MFKVIMKKWDKKTGPSKTDEIRLENMKRLKQLQSELTELEVDASMEDLEAIAVKRLLDCYTPQEVKYALEYLGVV